MKATQVKKTYLKSLKLKKDEKKTPILIVAGEVSGDNLAGLILESLNSKKENKDQYHFFGCGGPEMKKSGVKILFDIKSMEVIGIEGLLKYPFLRSCLNRLVSESRLHKVKDAILVDYPGFNLLLAEKLNQLEVRCHFIVSPQIWAWNYKRVYKIKKVRKECTMPL